MNEGRATEMQMQIRRNAEELHSFLKDLESWEVDIKKKDESLTRQKPILKEQLPPIRSRQSMKTKTKEKKKKKKAVTRSDKGAKRITSFDYNAWDKFDVDRACEEVDYEVRSTESSSEEDEEEEEEDEEGEEMRRKQRAIMEKEKGNELFKKGAHEEAVERYSVAMQLDPTSAVMPANRALALLKLERYAAAEADCTVALELDDTYVKAYLRRATARVKLGNPQAARQDFESILRLESGNKTAKMELERLDKELGTSGLRYIRAVKRPPHLRSKKPLKRIFIEDTGVVPSNVGAPKQLPLVETLMTERHGNSSTIEGSCSSGTPDAPPSTIPPARLITEVNEFTSGKGSSTEKTPESQSNVASGSEDSPPDLPGSTGSKMSVVMDGEQGSQRPHKDRGQRSGGVCSDGGGIQPVMVPGVPQTSLQFQTDWKQLKRYRDKMAEYFKAIPVSKYSVLLQQSLETDVFSDIIDILHNNYIKCSQLCLAELQGLVKVQRFSVAIMFLSTRQKEGLSLLFKDLMKLVADDEHNKETVRELANIYSVNNTEHT